MDTILSLSELSKFWTIVLEIRRFHCIMFLDRLLFGFISLRINKKKLKEYLLFQPVKLRCSQYLAMIVLKFVSSRLTWSVEAGPGDTEHCRTSVTSATVNLCPEYIKTQEITTTLGYPHIDIQRNVKTLSSWLENVWEVEYGVEEHESQCWDVINNKMRDHLSSSWYPTHSNTYWAYTS